MFRVEELQFGRVSWYYQEVANDSSPGDMSGGRFTPLGLGARWILRKSGWTKGARVVDLGAGLGDIDGQLMSAGVEVIPSALVSDGYVDGGYLIGKVESVLDVATSGKLGGLHKRIFPFGRILFAVEMPFASNHGFDRVLNVRQQENEWLGMPSIEFLTTMDRIPRDLVLESPALLFRLLCAHLRAEADSSTLRLKLDDFLFDPDVMTTPVGMPVISQEAALQLAEGEGRKANRRGVVLIGLTRTAKI